MSVLQSNDVKRQCLLERLLDAVKQCQIRFGGRKEIASDSDSRVICLCAQFEAVLQHGLKRSRGLALTAAAIKQAAGFASKTETEPAFWVYVKEILNKHELQRFYALKNITTDIGRGRAWLRCALNEHSLERYIHMLLGDPNRLSAVMLLALSVGLCIDYIRSVFLASDFLKSSLIRLAYWHLLSGKGASLGRTTVEMEAADLLSGTAWPNLPTNKPLLPPPPPLLGRRGLSRSAPSSAYSPSKQLQACHTVFNAKLGREVPCSLLGLSLLRTASLDHSPTRLAQSYRLLGRWMTRSDGGEGGSQLSELCPNVFGGTDWGNGHSMHHVIGGTDWGNGTEEPFAGEPLNCQIRFGGRKEIASDSDSRVICLCAQFEAVLQHGLKRSRGLALTAAAIKQAAGFASKTETEPAFWVYVKEILNKHELQRFYALKNITTDIGRGRAWLRCALNEHSLERYIHMLLGDPNRLSFFYEDWSFLLDEERSSMLPNMAAGLNSILFAINIDNKDLNGQAKSAPTVSDLLKESTQNVTSLLKESTQGVSSLLREITASSAVSILIKPEQGSDPLPVLSKSVTSDSKTKKDRKKKKKVSNIISFDDDGAEENLNCVDVSKKLVSSRESSEFSDRSSATLTHFEAQFDLNLHEKDSVSASWNNDSLCVNGDIGFEKLDVKSIDDEDTDDYDVYNAQTINRGRKAQNATSKQTRVESSENPQVCCWAPLHALNDNADVLFPVNAASPYSHSDSTLDNLPYGNETERATLAVELAQRGSDIQFSMETGSPAPVNVMSNRMPVTSGPESLTISELRQAVVLLMNAKDELEEQNTSLRNLLDSEMEHSSALRLEIDNLKRKVAEQEERHAAKIQALARENEVLKVQLKKYVGAVQMLKREGQSDARAQSICLEKLDKAFETDFDDPVKLLQNIKWHLNFLGDVSCKILYQQETWVLPLWEEELYGYGPANATTMAHIHKQDVTRSASLEKLSANNMFWAENSFLGLQAVHIKGIHDSLAVSGRDGLRIKDWSLSTKIFLIA
ncbi:sorting nexin-29 [Pelobates cultripes]|uniref:Sorting nexin-29, partial n=1 Tax=Pelobates cultripes TaxID=61616 RepID=A0AAD1SPJ5_PELCU|nr:sorting nexin-29 [Pelobates cultripes]